MPKPIIATYPVPAGAPQNADFEVSVNGRPIGVFANGPHTFAAFSFDRGPVDICITCLAPFTGVRIRPCAAGIAPRIKGRDIAFALAAPQKLSVEIQDGPNLFLYQAGAVFEIRTVDGARIENILFENIRIEEDHQPLIRFDMKNWYKVGDRQGHVRGVYLRDISVANGAGECVLEGADEAHGYRDIHFWQVRIDGALVGDPSPLGTMPTCVENLTFDCDLRPPPDDVPPRLLLVRAYPTSAAGETAVIFLTLSKSISRDPALDAACYRIPGSRILSVGITPGFRQIALAVEGLRKDAVLEIAGLRDLAGNALSPASPAPVVYRPYE